jgi:ERCC4-type nuclease
MARYERTKIVFELRAEAAMLITAVKTSRVMTKDADMLERDKQAVTAFEEIRAAREEQLRHLLSWLQDLATNPLHSMTETSSLAEETASRLKKILDGEA